jgi:ParB-like chromosome segregation protein Spo0J
VVGVVTLYQLLPPLTDREYAELVADIREHGVVVPVVEDEAGNVLDGYHRLRAVAELRAEGVAVPDPPVVVRSGLTEAQKVAVALGLNLHRRHLTEYQRVRLARRVMASLREEAREVSRRNLRQFRPDAERENRRTRDDPAAAGRTTDRAAELVGLGSGRTLEKHETVIRWVEAQSGSDPVAADLLARAERGEADMKQLRRYQRTSATPAADGPQATAPVAGVSVEARDVRDLKTLDPHIQGRTPWYRVALTARDLDAVTAWIYASGDPERINAFRRGTVNLILPRQDVIRYRDDLQRDGYPGLASAFGAALEADPDDVMDFGDLTSEERAVINRIRQTDTGIVEIRVVHGTPKVPPLRHWRWGQGSRRRREGEG